MIKKAAQDLITDMWGKKWLDGVMHAFEEEDAFVAVADGEVVGGMTLDWGSFGCLLDELIVRSDYRGHHIGSRLLDYSLKYAKKKRLKFIKAFVESNNKGALNLYKRYGFKQGGELRNLYAPGDHYVYIYKFLD